MVTHPQRHRSGRPRGWRHAPGRADEGCIARAPLGGLSRKYAWHASSVRALRLQP